MSSVKTDKEIEAMKEGGRRLADVLGSVVEATTPGTTSQELEDIARDGIAEYGDEPAFLGYQPAGADEPFPAALCVSINDEIVHGIPNDTPKEIHEGDLVSLDTGLVHEGLVVDRAYTVGVGAVSDENAKLMETTRAALAAGIEAARAGNHVGDISAAIQAEAESGGYAIYRQLIGHGVGYEVHEQPNIPNVGTAGSGEELKPGMVIAIEPMIGRGGPDIFIDDDGYTYRTRDESISAHFEHTVAITKEGPEILTSWSFEDKQADTS